ncbi:nucleotidyltransferase domain-containing protein [Roseiarcaceae bacterium H3SJ34-1]|uniref:nucleotidyltransferase family protein n=1 Tax=Terripilifer ovatus TaxID=3032367 RepID=UPI003AB99212|nr:nucleotidyltransferase domain-containing protein [Roseiarcaceae bacterium H3SJ34-1]
MQLSSERISKLRNWASDHWAVYALWLFGSRARDAPRPDSDVDIALELMPRTGPDDLPFVEYFFEFDKWKEELSALISSPISLVPWRDDIPNLRFDPRIGGVCLWTRGTEE